MKFITDLIKAWIKRNSLLMEFYNWLEIQKITRIFQVPDFKVKRISPNRYRIDFTNLFGYRLKGYSPEFWYDPVDMSWNVKFGKSIVQTLTNPVFQLINELRGYSLLNNINNGGYIIDAGASDGLSSKFFAALAGHKGKVLALEPDPSASLTNLAPNIIHVTACLSKNTGKTKLSLDTFGGSHIGEEGIEAFTYSLTDLIKKYKFSKGTFIKCDIEGAEVEIIEDILKLVSKKPNLIVAIASYHKVDGQESWISLEKNARKYPLVMAKTVYPYHATTFILNKKNTKILKRLSKLPAYNEIYDKVWPHGEK